jgi:DNA-binding transcriptional LysR family regulator
MHASERLPARFYKQNRAQQLRGFYHVAITGSFSTAADRMALGQPAVSLQIQALERELKAKLFERKRGAVTLTLEGRALFEVAVPVVEALETIDDAFRERLGQYEAGKVTCAATDDLVLQVLPHLVEKFTAAFPHIELVLYSCTSSQAVEMVARGDTDLGIGKVSQTHRQIRFQPLARFDNYLVAPLGHPLTRQDRVSLADVAQYPLVAPIDEGKLWQTIHRMLLVRDLEPHIVLRVASTLARLQYVEAGLGLTITSLNGVAPELMSKLAWIWLSDELPETAFGLITRANSYLSLPAKRFAEFLVTSVPASLTLGGQPAGPMAGRR